MSEFFINIILWNVKGASSRVLLGIIKDFKRMYQCDMVVLLEPRISGSKAAKVIKSLGFGSSSVVEAAGFSRGI